MAGTTSKSRDNAGLTGGARRQSVIELNKLIDDVELIRAWATALTIKLDLDAGVTDANYAAAATMTAIDTAAELLAAKVGNEAGTAISA